LLFPWTVDRGLWTIPQIAILLYCEVAIDAPG